MCWKMRPMDGPNPCPFLLQISLGVVTREKMNIKLLHELGITSFYDEVMRFKSSAAHAASKDIKTWDLK